MTRANEQETISDKSKNGLKSNFISKSMISFGYGVIKAWQEYCWAVMEAVLLLVGIDAKVLMELGALLDAKALM